MRAGEYEHLEQLFEEYQEINRRDSMAQAERDREDLYSNIMGIAFIGAVIFLYVLLMK